jgi:heme/copper-type cytochrome/quinol oxidase subunit 3
MDASSRGAVARSSRGAAGVARTRVAQPSGWWGMALFLCAEATLFGILIATYFYLDFDARSWPPDGIKPPSVTLPLLATAVLITTTVPLLLAVRASRAGLRWRVVQLIVLAMVVQCCYLALQILLFRHDLRQFSPKDSAYGSIYFTILAAHHAHVALGILLELAVLWQVVRKGLTNYWLIGVRTVALYWYVVCALAVFVVFTQLSPSL